MKLMKVKKRDYKLKERLAIIRRQNVERHAGYEAKQTLRTNILRHQTNATNQLEYDRLKASTVQGNLAQHAEARIHHLKKVLLK